MEVIDIFTYSRIHVLGLPMPPQWPMFPPSEHRQVTYTHTGPDIGPDEIEWIILD